jgi:uncharacterized damage-inducible protein DinB
MTEYWLRGPIAGVPALLQPVAHALLQARDEINSEMEGFPQALIWDKPAGLASVAFHLQHLSGVLDRLFTYAKGKGLSEEQFNFLNAEGIQTDVQLVELIRHFDTQVNISIAQLSATDTKTLTDFRAVGRSQLPSTVIGLLIHAAEHTMRHTGQLLVTARIINRSK